MVDEEYKKLLKQFHKLSDRHILIVETDMSSCDVQKVVALSDKIKKAGNELVGLMTSLCVLRDIASCLNYMGLQRIRKNVKILLSN